jgi:pectinesterase
LKNPLLEKILTQPILQTLCLLAWISCASHVRAQSPDATVSKDGSAQHTTLQDAINQAPQTSSSEKPWTILIKPGTYRELVYVQREKRFIRLIGEDPLKTLITYDLHASLKGPDGLQIGTFRTPTTTIDADDFTVENLTFENTAGPVGQALAIRIDGDRASFRNCRFLGFQDTILNNRGRHYFEDCTIVGAVDFIFGGATAYFHRCRIQYTRSGYITAASTPPDQPFGFVFSHCSIAGTGPGIKSYLGRPWRAFASTLFMNSQMDDVIRPEGWHHWDQPEREKTARYAEFNNSGPGAETSRRVSWARQLTSREAQKISVETVLGGSDGWNPQLRK